MSTEFLLEYELYDTTALQDGTGISSTNQTFANLTLLKEKLDVPMYATLEHNFFLLDGANEEFPEEPDNLAYYSSGISEKDGSFTDEQSLTIKFTENHTSIGLTLFFEDVYPLEIEISWYDLTGILKAKKTFHPDSLEYFAEKQVEEYGRIKIVFVKTLPYHNVKLSRIEYGSTYTWGAERIKTGKLTEETDPIGNTIKVNRLNFSFVDKDNSFNIGNVDGLHKTFQRKQRMTPYEIINGKKVNLGVYFMDTNSTTNNICQITAQDLKGFLDSADFTEGRIYEGESAGDIIDEIMSTAGITDYEVEEVVRNIPLYGTLKIQTCRKALREVLFACGATITTSRRESMYIHKASRIIGNKIARNRKFSTTIAIDTYVSDVTVKYKTWTLASESKQLTKGNYKAGTHTIKLSNPAKNLVSSTGAIIKQMPYYLILQLDADSEVVISGQKWEGEELSVLSSIEKIKSGEIRSAKSFTGTLLDFTRAQEIADQILDYYQLQQMINIRYLAEEEYPGEWLEIENPVNGHGNLTAGIESLITDLTGGFIQTAKCRGYYKLLSQLYYSDEIFADEEVGIL